MENAKTIVNANEDTPPVTKRPLYSKSKVEENGRKINSIAFGKRDLPVEPVERGIIPQTEATKDTVVYGKFNDALNKPFENLKELLQD